jgi:hypothetical protein
MANSSISVITFLLATFVYYLNFKPALTYKTMGDADKYAAFMKSNYTMVAIYFMAIVLIQIIVNASIITGNCGGSISANVGSAGHMTFIPWLLIFGVLILILTIFPGFKCAFSDVIGYYWVSKEANKVITELLLNREISNVMNDESGNTPEQGELISKKGMVGGEGSHEMAKLQEAADLIVKICGNNAILINQMVPENFLKYWDTLKPLMKPQYRQDESPDSDKIKESLFKLIVSRDNVGEALWYIYTGLFVTMFVQYRIATLGCQSDPQTMEQNYQTYLENEQQSEAEKQKVQGTTYTLS